MKRFLILAVFFVVGCDREGAYKTIKDKYPLAEVINVPGEDYKWLVKTSNEVIYFHYNNSATFNSNFHQINLFKFNQ